MLTYKYRLYPSKNQQKKLWLHANKLNWLYNYFLNQRIEEYKNNKKSIKKSEQQHEITQLIKNDAVLKEIHSQVRQQVTDRLNKTYKDFFRRKFGFPKFRSCKKFFGITYPQSGYSIKKNVLITKVYGVIKFKKHRKYLGNIKTVSITTDGSNWFINITTDYITPKNNRKKSIGIDLGQIHLITTNDGNKIKTPTHAKYFDKQIAKLQTERSKYKKGGCKYKSLSSTIKKLYGVKSRKINDFLHKISKNLSSTYDTVFCEDIDCKKMSESEATGLNRENRNSQFGKFISQLEYKVNNLIKVNPFMTSQTCSKCNHVNINKSRLQNRIFVCESCRNTLDRDINAAKNIYLLGTSLLLQSSAINTGSSSL